MTTKITRRAAPKKAPRAEAKKAPRGRAGKTPPARAKKAPAASPRYEPGRLVVCAESLGEGVAALRALDPETIGLLLEIGGPPPLRAREPGFAGLAAIIVSQQVSVASAAAIFGRLEAQVNPLTAAAALAAGEATLKACGLSGPKIRGILSAARAVAEQGLDLAGLAALPAADAHRRLVAVKGIGPWTADIFLLFCLGHPDAFPAGDLAMQEAAKLALGLKMRPDAKTLERLAERWRPYRGVAARMLWAYYQAAKSRAGVLELAKADDSPDPAARRTPLRWTAPSSRLMPHAGFAMRRDVSEGGRAFLDVERSLGARRWRARLDAPAKRARRPSPRSPAGPTCWRGFSRAGASPSRTSSAIWSRRYAT